MVKNKFINRRLLLLTFAAGAVWWLIGEYLLSFSKYWTALGFIQNAAVAGLYFAFLVLLTLGVCILSEKRVHSLVSEEIYKRAVLVPGLKFILPLIFAGMFAISGILQFIYEFDINNSFAIGNSKSLKPVKRKTAQKTPVSAVEGIDYYLVIDNSSSMGSSAYPWFGGNDPENERLSILSNRIDRLTDFERVAVINFGESADIVVPLQYADKTVKNKIKSFIKAPKLFPGTNIVNALLVTSSILSNDTSRKGVVILVSDGESSDDGFEAAISHFVSMNVPIYTIGINTINNYADFSLLKRIADATGGRMSTVDNFEDYESKIDNTIQVSGEAEFSRNTGNDRSGNVDIDSKFNIESRRMILIKRTGEIHNSGSMIWQFIYGLFHIIIISLIGLLIGIFICKVFPSRQIEKPMLTGGCISGIFAGIVLEFCLQFNLQPSVVRFLTCVILSTVPWVLVFAIDYYIKKHSGGMYGFYWNLYLDSKVGGIINGAGQKFPTDIFEGDGQSEIGIDGVLEYDSQTQKTSNDVLDVTGSGKKDVKNDL